MCCVVSIVVACVVWCEVHRWATDPSMFLVCEDCEWAVWVNNDRKVEVLPWWRECQPRVCGVERSCNSCYVGPRTNVNCRWCELVFSI